MCIRDRTYNAVVAFQKEFGIPPTGLVGVITWSKILETYYKLKGVI